MRRLRIKRRLRYTRERCNENCGWSAGGGTRRRRVIHAVHSYPPQFTERKRSKKKEERPTTGLFFSSNNNGNDHLKSGQLWSEQPGAPHITDPKAEKTIIIRIRDGSFSITLDSWNTFFQSASAILLAMTFLIGAATIFTSWKIQKRD